MDKTGDSRAGGNRYEQTFREWLLEQLKLSRWSVMDRESVAEAAKRLGVQEDILEQAINERASGKRLHSRRELVEQRLLKLWMPKEVGADFVTYCKVLSVTPAMMLRSATHSFLLNPITTPMMLDRRWIYRGRRYSAQALTRHHLMCRVSRGAMQAVDFHARKLKVPTAWLLKGLALDVLEGRTRQIKIVTAGEMWGDPKRYLEPQSFLQQGI